MRPRATTLLLLVACACGGDGKPRAASPASDGDAAATAPPGDDVSAAPSAPASASASASASSPPAASTPPTATATGPIPTGGTVLVGDIVAPKGFDPKATLEGAKDKLVACYNRSRAADPKLAGKLTLQISVGEGGSVQSVMANPGGHANVPDLVACLNDALRTVRFPKPGGTAIVTAPLVFHP